MRKRCWFIPGTWINLQGKF